MAGSILEGTGGLGIRYRIVIRSRQTFPWANCMSGYGLTLPRLAFGFSDPEVATTKERVNGGPPEEKADCGRQIEPMVQCLVSCVA